jgi:DNA mismatch repair ATPase MutS
MNTQSNFSEAAPLEAAEMRCMSVFIEGDKMAFACYIEEKNEILLEQSHANGHDTEAVAELFLGVARPNLLLCSKKIAMNLELLQILTRPTNSEISNEDTFMSTECEVVRTETSQNRSNSIPFKILKSGAFDLKSCRLLLLQKLRVLSLLRQNQEHREQTVLAYHRSRPEIFLDNNGGHSVENCTATTNIAYNSLAALIDFESSTLIRALGSLVTYLQDTAFRMEDGCTVTVNSITYVKSTSFMRIDATTLHSLHIFSTEYHPLIAKGSGNSKEGFSLFTLLDRCKSKVGRQCLREWMLKPVLDPLEISRRQGKLGFMTWRFLHSLILAY